MPNLIVPKQKNLENRDMLTKVNVETETFRPRVVGYSIAQQIIQARCSKKLNQKQLAHLMCKPLSVITEHETGKAIYNPTIISLFERTLQIKIVRPA